MKTKENIIAKTLENILKTTDKETKLALMMVLFNELCINPDDYLKTNKIT